MNAPTLPRPRSRSPHDRPPFRFAARTLGLKPSAIREILKVTAAPDVISFAGGLPAPELFPVAPTARAAAEMLAEDGAAALQYSVTEGHPALRAWICAHLAETVGLRATPDQVLITNGSQQGLDLLAKVLVDPGDTVVVENPAYLGALQAFRAYEAQVIGVPADDEGMRPDELRRVLASSARPPKFLYLIANFQNPTGTSISAQRRAALVALAAEFGVPVIEDDPYGRLRYTGTAQPALGALPGAADWVYLGTSSKIMAPGLRVAWLVAPDRGLYDKLVAAKQAADLHTSIFTQQLVWRYVRQPGVLDAHIGQLCTAYRSRRDVMLDALARHLPDGCTWTRPEGGMFLWVRLPESFDTLELLRAAAARKVAFVPGESFWVGTPVRHTLRLNFSHATEARIGEGVHRLGEIIKAAMA
jgi:2-aminoadipate transaminase